MYKSINFTHALGVSEDNDVLADFTVGEDASKSLRIEVVTSVAAVGGVALEHSMNGTSWEEVKTSTGTGTTQTIIINASDTTVIPLKPLCRVVATASITVVSVQIARNI